MPVSPWPWRFAPLTDDHAGPGSPSVLKMSDLRNEAGAAAAMVCRTRCGSRESFGNRRTATSPVARASKSARCALSRVTSSAVAHRFEREPHAGFEHDFGEERSVKRLLTDRMEPAPFERLVDKGQIKYHLVPA